jgi:hypothetical protein
MLPGIVGAIAFAITSVIVLAWGIFWPLKSPTNVVRWFLFAGWALISLLNFTAVALDQLFRTDGRIQWGTSASWVLSTWMLVAIVSFARFAEAGARWMAPGFTVVAYLAFAIGVWFDGFGFTAWFIIGAILHVFVIFALIFGGWVDLRGTEACPRPGAAAVSGFNWHGLLWAILLSVWLVIRLVFFALQVWIFNDPNDVWIHWIYLFIDLVAVVVAFLCIWFLKPLVDVDIKPLSNVSVQSVGSSVHGNRAKHGSNADGRYQS